MTISVLIPVYNAARTIEATLASVMRQTVAPDEIILLLDGCTDDTEDRIGRFGNRITVARQENRGVALTRNRLAGMARGELLAYLDNDDFWHPKYLETQRALLRSHPGALASFCGHVDVAGPDEVWREEPSLDLARAEWIDQVEFFERYNRVTGLFGSMSFACIRQAAMKQLGPEPFQFNGVDDSYLFCRLSLLGGVVFLDSPLVAYLVRDDSLSANRLKMLPQWVKVFETLAPEFQKTRIEGLRAAFPIAYAVKRRNYAKMLLGAGRPGEARGQLWRSMADCPRPVSVGKSAALWAASLLPAFLQPRWPSARRASAAAADGPQLSSPSVGAPPQTDRT
jgi:glycosyltransferase involved in cell wall biosynthesis